MEALQYDENGNPVLPRPEDFTYTQKNNASSAYILVFASLYFPIPLVEIIMSIIYYNVLKYKTRFSAFHSYQADLIGWVRIELNIVCTRVVIFFAKVLLCSVKIYITLYMGIKIFEKG